MKQETNVFVNNYHLKIYSGYITILKFEHIIYYSWLGNFIFCPTYHTVKCYFYNFIDLEFNTGVLCLKQLSQNIEKLIRKLVYSFKLI